MALKLCNTVGAGPIFFSGRTRVIVCCLILCTLEEVDVTLIRAEDSPRTVVGSSETIWGVSIFERCMGRLHADHRQ